MKTFKNKMPRKIIKTTFMAAALAATFATSAMAALPENATVISVPGQTIQLEQKWDKIFPRSDKVDHRKVTFKNRFGFTLAADLYVLNCQAKCNIVE